MKKKIIVYYPFPDDLLAAAQERFDVAYFPEEPTPDAQESFTAALTEAEGIILSPAPRLDVTETFLDRAPKLRSVATVSVGYDHCDVPAMTRRGVTLTHTPDPLTGTTADMAFALVMATARRVVELDRRVRAGEWPNSEFGVNVHHKTLGVVGMGRIGTAVAKRARGFEMPVVYTARSPKPDAEKELGAQHVSLDKLLAVSDFVCLTVALSEETRGMISREKLALMKPDAILVNIARGPVVDEEALADALRDRTIRAAGLDVFTVEPLPMNSPLRNLDNVVLMPHVGSGTAETRREMMACALENLSAALDGSLKKNCVNSELLQAT